jgi:hypothetical protein
MKTDNLIYTAMNLIQRKNNSKVGITPHKIKPDGQDRNERVMCDNKKKRKKDEGS